MSFFTGFDLFSAMTTVENQTLSEKRLYDTHICTRMNKLTHMCTLLRSFSPSKTSGQSVGTAGCYGVMYGWRENGGYHFTTVSLPQFLRHIRVHTQRQRHTLHFVPTDMWGFLVPSSLAARVAAWSFSLHHKAEQGNWKSSRPRQWVSHSIV